MGLMTSRTPVLKNNFLKTNTGAVMKLLKGEPVAHGFPG